MKTYYDDGTTRIRSMLPEDAKILCDIYLSYGRIREVTDEEKMREKCTLLTQKFTDDDEYLQRELAGSFKNVKCLELIPEHMTGKLVNEA